MYQQIGCSTLVAMDSIKLSNYPEHALLQDTVHRINQGNKDIEKEGNVISNEPGRSILQQLKELNEEGRAIAERFSVMDKRLRKYIWPLRARFIVECVREGPTSASNPARMEVGNWAAHQPDCRLDAVLCIEDGVFPDDHFAKAYEIDCHAVAQLDKDRVDENIFVVIDSYALLSPKIKVEDIW